VASTGLKPDEFARLQETVVTLRDNLLLTPSTGAK